MYKLITLILIFGNSINGAEIDSSKFRSVLKSAFSKSEQADEDIANDFKQFDKSTWQQTFEIIPKYFFAAGNAYKVIANEFNTIRHELLENQHIKNNHSAYVPDKIFNEITDGFSAMAQVLDKLIYDSEAYVMVYLQNTQIFVPNAAGDLSKLTEKLGSKIIWLKAQIKLDMINLQEKSKSMHGFLINALDYINKRTSRVTSVIQKGAVPFQQAVDDFGVIIKIIEQVIAEYKSLGIGKKTPKYPISARKYLHEFNVALQTIGSEYSLKAKQMNAAKLHLDSSTAVAS